jgi:hypothetical protein
MKPGAVLFVDHALVLSRPILSMRAFEGSSDRSIKTKLVSPAAHAAVAGLQILKFVGG